MRWNEFDLADAHYRLGKPTAHSDKERPRNSCRSTKKSANSTLADIEKQRAEVQFIYAAKNASAAKP